MSQYLDAMQFELEAEYNAYHDYHSELWASEIESMSHEGEYAEQEAFEDYIRYLAFEVFLHTAPVEIVEPEFDEDVPF